MGQRRFQLAQTILIQFFFAVFFSMSNDGENCLDDENNQTVQARYDRLLRKSFVREVSGVELSSGRVEKKMLLVHEVAGLKLN